MGPLISIFAHAHVAFLPDHESLMFLFPLLPGLMVGTIVVGVALDKRGALGAAGRTVALSTPLAIIAAMLSLAAAGIHFAVISDHLDEGAIFGVLFFALGWFQLVWAQVYLIWQRRPLALLAIVINIGAVLVWVISRTVGLPFGPTPWVPEQLGFPDLLASSLELSMVGLLLPTLLGERYRETLAARMPAQKAFVLTAFTTVAVVVLTAMALIPPAFDVLAFQ